MKTLIFDLYGDYGHFRRYYATTSPVTFSIMPPPAVLGLIAAILGLPKDENKYLEELNRAKTLIAIKIIKPVKKVRIGMNLINTKSNIWVPKNRSEGARTQIKYEFLKDVFYRIYVAMENNKEMFEQLAALVKEHKCHYTVSLGLSELLADFTYVNIDNFELMYNSDNKFVNIETVLPMKLLNKNGIKITDGNRILKERLPVYMNHNRITERYEEILIETLGSPLKANPVKYWANGNNQSIMFINDNDNEA